MGENRKGRLEKIFRIIPSYGWAPLIICLAFHLFTFYGTRYINGGFTHYDVSIGLDEKIPFWTPFIVFYVSAFAQWAFGLFSIARAERDVCWTIFGADLIAKIICCVIFLAFPTSLVRTEVTGSSIFDQLTRMIYSLDSPDNLFPSLHVEASWLCFRGIMKIRTFPRWVNVANGVLTVLICLSILFVKQHLCLDLAAGLVVVELGLFLERNLRISRIYTLFDRSAQKRSGV